MKIKVQEKSYDEVMAMPIAPPLKPTRQSIILRNVMKILSQGELKKAHFSCEKEGMDKITKGTPVLYLMNHSSFIDLKIAATLIYPNSFHIVCTSDGFVGKNALMRHMGCIPTNKFITDVQLVKDLIYTLKDLKSSVLMYPEASYSFDGTATPLPEGLGKCIKLLKVPVVMISTFGAFARDPLYNGLQIRDVDVSAKMECILTPEQIAQLSVGDINSLLEKAFTFDQFKWQQDNNIKIKESFRADGLNRVLYKCPCCKEEGRMKGAGTTIRCESCGKSYELTEDGYLKASSGETEFNHIPDWYRWQRECIRKELKDDSYLLKVPVEICMMINTKSIYKVGNGELIHTREGFHLTGCDGQLDYEQKPLLSYSLYSDFFWYEIGDVICIGNNKVLYYCFPQTDRDVVAKTRLATEELYKMIKVSRMKKG